MTVLQKIEPHKVNGMNFGHSTLSSLMPTGGVYRADDGLPFSDPLAESLLATRPMQRLAHVGFLGAIDYIRHGNGSSPHRRRHNRLEHSIGVARLADIYANTAKLTEDRRLLIVAAALLHDVGHGPLSHTLEPVFEREYGINHHIVTQQIIKGETVWGCEIKDLLSEAGVDIDELIALIDGEHDGDVGFLFSGQINLDTLEGITRCRAFVGRQHAYLSAPSIVRKWASKNHMPSAEFDAFWELKHTVYNLFIGAERSAALDAVTQAYMVSNLSLFSQEDFFLDEKAFRKNHRALFHHLDKVSLAWKDTRTWKELVVQLPEAWLSTDVAVKLRSFVVHRDVELEGHDAINKRYRQSKKVSTKTLDELFAETLLN